MDLRGNRKRNGGEGANADEGERRAPVARGRAGGCGGKEGESQHQAVSQEEARAHGAFDPGKAVAFGASQLRIVHSDEEHEGDKEERREPCAPAAPSGNEKNKTGECFERSQPEGRGQAQ